MNEHEITMKHAPMVDGQYGWQALCNCEEFMAQAPTYTIMVNLCETHFAEVLINE